MIDRIKRIRTQKIYLFLLLSIFAFCFVIGAFYSRYFEKTLIPNGVILHFSPDLDGTFWRYVKHFSSAFYDDAFNALYIFVAGFMIWGKAMIYSLVALRGVKLGYYIISLANTYLIDSSLFSVLEYILFLLVNSAIAFLIILFSRESIVFNDKIKDCYPKRFTLLKTSVFFGYITDMVIICGIIAVCKTIYTFLIILL